jgi:hypothetical protein
MWEIKGVPEEVRDEYSSRGREIQGAVGAEATLRSRDVAAKDTRRAKVDPSHAPDGALAGPDEGEGI